MFATASAVRRLWWRGSVLHLLLLMLHLLLHLVLLLYLLLHLALLILLRLMLLLLHVLLLLLHLLPLLVLRPLLFALLILYLLLTLLFLSALLLLLLVTLLLLHLLLALLFLLALLVLLIYLLLPLLLLLTLLVLLLLALLIHLHALLVLRVLLLLALLFLLLPLLVLLVLQVLLLLSLLFLLLVLLVLQILLLHALLLVELLALLLVHVLLHALLVLQVLLLLSLLVLLVLLELLALLRIHVLLHALLVLHVLLLNTLLLFKLLPLLLIRVCGQCAVEAVLSGVQIVSGHGGHGPGRRNDAALCRQRLCCRDHVGAAAILLEELRTVLHGCLAILHLRLHRRYTLLAHCSKFLRCRAAAKTAVAAVVGDTRVVDVRVVDDFHAAVVDVVVYPPWLHAIDCGVVPEVIVIPVATLVAEADVAEAVIDATVVADVLAPIAVVPAIATAVPAPPSGRPQRTNVRRRNPCSGDVVVTGGCVIPIAGGPHIVRAGGYRLFIVLGQWGRWFCCSGNVGIEQGVVFVVFRGVGSLLVSVGLAVAVLLWLRVVVDGLLRLLLLIVALIGRGRGVVLQSFILRVAASLWGSLRSGLRCVAGAIALRHGGVANAGHLGGKQVRIGRIGGGGVAVHDRRGIRRVAAASRQDEAQRGNKYCRPVERYVLHKNPQGWSDAVELSAVDPILHESNPVWEKGLRETISASPALLKSTRSALP